MLIEIDRDYEKVILHRSKFTQEESDSFSSIFESVVTGKNYFKATQQFFDFCFLHSNCFSHRVKIYLHSMSRSYSTLMSNLTGLMPALMITNNASSNLNISLNCYSLVNVSNIPEILFGSMYCEDMSDCTFYEKLYNEICQTKLNVFLDKQTYGGGAAKSTISVLLAEKKKVFFCIADSDKSYSSSALGSTALSLNDLYINNHHCFSTLYILQVREKENLLPYSLVSTLDCFNDEQKELLSALNGSSDEIKDYFDVKDGMTKKCRKRIKVDSNLCRVVTPIKRKMQRIGMYHANAGTDKLINGIGSRGAENALQHIDSFKTNYLHCLTNNQKSDLDTIFTLIKRFCLAFEMQYS